MPAITLTEAQQVALRSLMAIEPTPGRPMSSPQVLRLIESLVPCDAMGILLGDDHGTYVEEVVLPHSYVKTFRDVGEPAAPDLGVMRWTRNGAAAHGALDGVQDRVAVRFRNGRDAVSEIWFDRKRHEFTDDEVARIVLLTPVLQRLLCQRPTPHLPAALTVQERRVLVLVATGMSNAEVASHLFVSVGTVRKHLEHAYRKLGVHNRMAAVTAFEGGTVGRPGHVAAIRKYA